LATFTNSSFHGLCAVPVGLQDMGLDLPGSGLSETIYHVG